MGTARRILAITSGLAQELRDQAAQVKCQEAREQMIVLEIIRVLAEHAAATKNGARS